MSVLQDYKKIRDEIGEKKYNEIELFLSSHPQYTLADVYYRQSVWEECQKWITSMNNKTRS